MPRRKDQLFTQGEWNKIIDSFLHPLAKQDIRYWAVDTLFHGIVEQDPALSMEKFIRYTLPKVLHQYAKQQSKRRGRG